jgi:ferrous iron transport protein A
MKTYLCLRQMKLGQSGTIVSIGAQAEMGRRIRDMGLVPGAVLTIVRRAPLKDPVALRLQGFTLMLRNNEADYITVEIEEE